MSIYRSRYTRYHGPSEPLRARYRAVAEMEIRRLARDKWFRRLMLLSGTPTLILGVFVYLAAIMEQGFGWNPLGGDVFTRLYGWQPSFIVLLFAGFGSAIISRDIKTRALTLVFTRPVTPFQYLLGKLGALMLAALVVTWLPGVVLALAQFVMHTNFGIGDLLDVLWKVTVTSLLIAWFMSSLILLLSATTGTSSRVTGMIWLMMFLCLAMLRAILANALGMGGTADVISPYNILYGTANMLFVGDSESLPALVSALGYSAFFTVALYFRLQALERAHT